MAIFYRKFNQATKNNVRRYGAEPESLSREGSNTENKLVVIFNDSDIGINEK